MKDKMNKSIVIGGSSYVGNAICTHFSNENKILAATYNKTKNKKLIKFNLESDYFNDLDINFKEAKYAIISSAITDLDLCKRESDMAYKINVQGTKNLITNLFEKDIIPVFFSSSWVFNGQKGNYSELDETNPNTVYGTHKREVEEFLENSDQEFLAFRISKVIGVTPGDGTLITSSIESFLKDEEVKCAYDQKFSPIYIKDLVEVLDISLDKNLRGTYNLGSPESFSRYDLVNNAKKFLSIEDGRITKISLKSIPFEDKRPLDTSINMERLISATEFKFMPMIQCFRELKNNYQNIDKKLIVN